MFKNPFSGAPGSTDPRTGMPDVQLSEQEFRARYLEQFADPAFGAVRAELEKVMKVAWDGYSNGRKAPRTAKAGAGYADPEYDLSDDWRAAAQAIRHAQAAYERADRKGRVLIVNGSSRSDHTCPGEMSKSFRIAGIAHDIFETGGCEAELLDLSRLSSEYGRKIYPCKACFSTSPALCHWPCSCYPNHGQGQSQDWMNEIYPMWVRADAVLVISPVNWYQVSSPLKLLMDRLVCADGGNPDPTSTEGKKAKLAKEIELKGWHYPRHLEGRLFGVVVHGDTEGAENTRRALTDWMTSIKMVPAGPFAALDRYIGYWQPYATSHEELDRDTDFQDEVRNVAKSILEAVTLKRAGRLNLPGGSLSDPREK